jgi:hypothetical protein
VVGHSIYLWVGEQRKALHRGEKNGCGCTFKHSQQEIYGVRERVFDFLDKNFGLYSVLESPPLLALARIETFHREVIRPRLVDGTAPVEMTYTFNVTTIKPQGATLFKSNDSIFANVPLPDDGDEEKHEPSKVCVEDPDKFPDLAQVVSASGIQKTIVARKTVSSRKDLPYQVDGL